MAPATAVGMVVSKKWWPRAHRPVQRVSKSKQRSMILHVGLCTHNSEVQGRLPQIFIGNHRCFTPPLMAAVTQAAPSKVKFWRMKSSWNTSALMITILTELALALADFPMFQPILVLDCASIHLTAKVLGAASAMCIWMLPVPARCAFLLQPCDTHVFSPHKAFLHNACRSYKNDNGIVTPEAWARALTNVAIVFMCSRHWLHAFEQTGILGNRDRLSRDLCALQAQLPALPVSMPTLAQMREILPRGRQVPYSKLLSEPRGRSIRVGI